MDAQQQQDRSRAKKLNLAGSRKRLEGFAQSSLCAMTPAQRELFKHAVFKFEPLPADWPANFAIITAYDPNGLTTDPGRNVAADEALAAELSTAGYRLHRITGGSADGTHVEPGWGVPIGLPEAIEYGRRYRQAAVFFVQGGRVALVDCTDGSAEVFGQPFKANTFFR